MGELFSVDRARCVKCGACVKDCAFRALSAGDDGFPAMASPSRCMRCQHCLATCPSGAVALDGRGAGGCVSAQGARLPSADEVANWIVLRRSTRKFRRESVDRAVLDRVLSLLGNSPTGCNARSLVFTCFPDREAMDAMRGKFLDIAASPWGKMLPRWFAVPAIRMRKGAEDMFFRGASGLLIVSSDTSNPEVKTPDEDVTIACSNFELLANANGIATCWLGFLGMIERELPGFVERLAGVKTGRPFQAMLFGLSALKYPRGVERSGYAKIEYRG
ncbi:MAG: nitroreductase family protein [Kiritimatiellae bacterium]|nr:nitroreductase family protein [Kiritimatiellia bacterium]